jgi:hypothetical protein
MFFVLCPKTAGLAIFYQCSVRPWHQGVAYSTNTFIYYFFGNTDMSYRFYEVELGMWVCDTGISFIYLLPSKMSSTRKSISV